MSAARVIYFGRDDCYRVPVLQHVGYEVRESDTLDGLRRDLDREEDFDAVIVSAEEPRCAEQAAVLVRERSAAPLILFHRPGVDVDESRFDRVYSECIPAANWLYETAVLVMRCKELRAKSERVRKKSEALRRESEALQTKTRHLIENSKRLVREGERNRGPAKLWHDLPDKKD